MAKNDNFKVNRAVGLLTSMKNTKLLSSVIILNNYEELLSVIILNNYD